MDDLISRQTAIDAFLTELTKRERKNLLHTWSTVKVKYFVADMLEHLPPAQPEQRWIPCSERLPEEYKYVLLCDREPEPDEDTGYSRMAVGWLEDGKFCCWDDRVARKEFVAWMPLPERYHDPL